jgi:hypothetical protein
MELTGFVQEQHLKDGSKAGIRQGHGGELMTSLLHGKYTEQAVRGNVFHAVTGNTAGVDPGSSLNTTPAFVIHNPRGSGKILSVISTIVTYRSGTLGAGSLVYAYAFDKAAPVGTARKPVNANFNGRPSIANQYDAPTLDAAPTMLKPFGSVGAVVDSTAVGISIAKDFPDGEILIPEGCLIALSNIGAGGTTPRVIFAVTYEEITS